MDTESVFVVVFSDKREGLQSLLLCSLIKQLIREEVPAEEGPIKRVT